MAKQDTTDTEVVIVGAGVAGALMAWRLGAASIKVTLLDAGAEVTSRADAVSQYGLSLKKPLGSPYGVGAPGPEHPGPANNYYDQVGPEDYLSTYERVVGGSTWHWLGHTPRLLPSDFRMHTAYGVGVDWPITYDDIEPWYCAAETALGVAGDDAQWKDVHGAHRSRGFPMQPIWLTWSDRYVAARADGLHVDGGKIQILATPAARNSRLYDDRPPCAGNASCVPICPIGAKYDASVHVRKALATGNVRLLPNAIAVRLHLGRSRRIDSVEYQRPDRSRARLRGQLFVVAANAIETAKLLLISQDASHAADGVANSSGLVGRCLMDHMQKSVFVRTRDPVYPFRGPPSTAGIETFRDGAFRSERSAMRFSLNNDGWARRTSGSPIAEVDAAIKAGLIGEDIRRRIFASVAHQLRISLSTEVLPEPDNRVSVSALPDADGVPRPKIAFSVPDYTRRAFAPALNVIHQLVRAIDGQIVEEDTDPGPGHYQGAGHVMGGCRMGKDPKSSVTDEMGRAHDHPNLHLCGAGLWPTCGTANPTLTVAALSLRMADSIASRTFRKTLGKNFL